jgi:hypothetical protein
MPSYKRSQIPRMRDLTIEEQDELIKRWRLRNALRTAYPEVIGAMMQWVIDSPDIEKFVSGGHETHFARIPQDDLFVRMIANGYTEEEFEEALKHDEAPASWMTPEELESIIKRISRMLDYFTTHEPGTFAQALHVYRLIGTAARVQFIQQYGYAPEQSPIPYVRITGEESERKKLKPDEHQPRLFS